MNTPLLELIEETIRMAEDLDVVENLAIIKDRVRDMQEDLERVKGLTQNLNTVLMNMPK